MVHNDSSPEDDLISSLERHGTSTFSASSTWKIRTNPLAQDDIRRERRAAIASGKLKCRRLSYDDDDDVDIAALNNYLSINDQILVPPIQLSDSNAEENCNETEFGKQKEEEELSVCLNTLSYCLATSSSSSCASSSPLCKVPTNEQMAANLKVEENVALTPTRTVADQSKEIGNWFKFGKWKLGLAWLGVASVVILVIFSVRCLGFGVYDEQQLPFLLVPT